LENVSVRATHAKSFNAASLAQSSEQGNTLIEVAVPDPNATGSMLNMLEVFGGNSQLRSEAAKSYTLGIDIGRPFLEEGGEISATYYYAEYSNRIGSPPIVGIQTAALEQGASLGPFVQRPPDPEMLAAVSKYQGGEAGLGTIDALYDGRVQNLAVAIFSGFGVSGRYRFMLERSYLDLSFMLDRLLQLEERSAAGADRVNFADTPFNPADLRLRFGSRWSWNQYSLGIRLDYTGSYWDAAINPARKVSSWLTADLLFSMDIDKQAELPAFRNLTLSVNVLNLTDRDPPSVSIGPSGSTLGYDGRNASPLGRSVLLLLGKRW
jgi:iron complex outermembrane receptor protein